MISDSVQSEIKLLVLECIKVLKQASGPAASRFESKLRKLLEGMVKCKQDQEDSLEKAGILNQSLIHTTAQVNEMNKKNKLSKDEIFTVKHAIDRNKKMIDQMVQSTESRNRQVQELIADNERLESCIKAGPGWTEAQTIALGSVIKEIESKKSTLTQDKARLNDMKEEIMKNEDIIDKVDRLRRQLLKEVETIDMEIDSAKRVDQDIEIHLGKADDQLEMLELSSMQEKDNIRSLKKKHNNVVLKQKSTHDELVNIQKSIDQNTRKLHECFKCRDKLLMEISKQKEKNHQIDVKNSEKVCQIVQRKELVRTTILQSSVLMEKKDLVSQKIFEIEEKRVQLEQERDKLKMKINQLVHGELNMQKKEGETQRRQREGLKREINLLERKKGLSEKSSQIAMDLIQSSEMTGKSLQHDLRAYQAKVSDLKAQIKSLNEDIEKRKEETKSASKRVQNSLEELNEQETLIQSVQRELEDSEIVLKQKQHLCEALKNECNAQSKLLVKNHEDIESVRREINVVDRQINQLKMDISNIEVELVCEHFDHHNTIADRDNLQTEMFTLRRQIDEVGITLERKEKETIRLHQSVNSIDEECDKHVKEYGVIIGYRDSIGNVLLRKNEDLEKIQEKIKTQQSLLHHCDIEYQEQMIQITEMIETLKKKTLKKRQLDKESLVYEEYLKQYNYLQTQVQHEKNQHIALKEELGRPMNIHRWRILEHRNPQKYEKIQNIQRLQTCLINVAGEVGEKEKSIREAELEYLQIKRIADRQPQMSEISQEANLYQSIVKEKSKEKHSIELDLNLVKGEVQSLRKALKNLEAQREDMKAKWIDTQTDS